MPLEIRFGFVVEYVEDIEASMHFYTAVMGLQVQRRHPRFVQFETFAIAGDEPMDGDGLQELYWLVEDIEAARRALAAKTRLVLPLTELPFGKVFGIRDPDGQPRYLLELSRNRPSVAPDPAR